MTDRKKHLLNFKTKKKSNKITTYSAMGSSHSQSSPSNKFKYLIFWLKTPQIKGFLKNPKKHFVFGLMCFKKIVKNFRTKISQGKH